MRSLEHAHPICCFAYIIAVVGITIFTRHPILLAESAAGAFCLLALSGKLAGALWYLPMLAAVMLTNPLFSHKGATVLFFVGDTAFTLEAIVYGAVFGIMLCACIGWSACGTKYVTSDKFIWLFGKILPSAGLALSCALRFVPLFIRRTREFAQAQRASSLKDYLAAFSASMSYSTEEAMSVADSMTARGFGTAKRTSYSLYRLKAPDLSALTLIVFCTAACIAGMCFGGGEFYYYPAISKIRFAAADIVIYSAYGVLCAAPSAAVTAESLRRKKRNSARVMTE